MDHGTAVWITEVWITAWTQGMDHGAMDMPAPGGIPLATGSENDRDGLEMDELSVSLGPVLPSWPAGLVLRCVLHGDLIADASVQTMPGRLPSASEGAGPETNGGAESAQWESAISLCDAVARL